MPLHQWKDDSGWSSVHTYWIAELGRWLKARLPEGYRSFIGVTPVVSVDVPGKPDVSVRDWTPFNGEPRPAPIASAPEIAAGESGVAVLVARTTMTMIAPSRYVYVEHHGRMVAAIELISPTNKNRPDRREAATTRYSAYLQNGIHLMLVDLLPRPKGFSFTESIAAELPIPGQPSCPAPLAASYLVGERSITGECELEIRQTSLTVGQPLPVLPLWLNSKQSVLVDLETTYMNAASDAYVT